MPKTNRETAATFTIAYLSQHADRDLQLADLYEGCAGRFSKGNLGNALTRLLAEGRIIRSKDGHTAWWAINLAAPPATVQANAVAQGQDDKPKAAVKLVNVIRSGRY